VVAEEAARSSLGLATVRFLRLHQGTKIRSAKGQPMPDRLYDIWDRRDVLRMLVDRGLRNKYSQSALGYAWSLLEPAMLIATYFLLVKIFHRSTPMYPLFITTAILPWQWFAQTVNSSTSMLRKNSRLITSIALPREIYPLSDVLVKTIEFLLSLPLVGLVAWFYGVRPSGYLFAWPIAFVCELMLCVGMALLLSSLNTVLRDVERGIGMVVRMMFYLTPALYALRSLPANAQKLEIYNPMAGILELNRAVWLPAYWTGWRPVWGSVIGSVVILIIGVNVFARFERAVLKEL
jgi:ABC-2 type transport system permease protein